MNIPYDFMVAQSRRSRSPRTYPRITLLSMQAAAPRLMGMNTRLGTSAILTSSAARVPEAAAFSVLYAVAAPPIRLLLVFLYIHEEIRPKKRIINDEAKTLARGSLVRFLFFVLFNI